MRFHASPRTTLAAAALVTGALSLSACSAGSLGSSDDESGKTTISFLTNNDPNNVKIAEAVVKAFEAANDDIDVKVDTRPGGGDGDNLVKTKLSTGDMAEVFEYNSGSLFQAIAPDDEPHAGHRRALGRRPGRDVRVRRLGRGAGVRRPLGQHHRRRHLLQHPRLREARARGPQDLGRVHRQQREDQGRRRHRAGRADLRRHLDQPDPRAGEQPQRLRGEPDLRRGLHRQQGEVRHHARGPRGLRALAGVNEPGC